VSIVASIDALIMVRQPWAQPVSMVLLADAHIGAQVFALVGTDAALNATQDRARPRRLLAGANLS
jgi:uncharacterized membrane protein YeiH